MDSSISLPTPEAPLKLLYPGHIPSIKNNRQPNISSKGKLVFQKNVEAQRWMQSAKPLVATAWPYLPLPPPVRIGGFVEMVFYRRDPTKLPASDGDNVATSLQETWKKTIVADDNQVGQFYWEIKYAPVRDVEHALVYLWVLDEDSPPIEQLIRFHNQRRLEASLATAAKLPEMMRKHFAP